MIQIEVIEIASTKVTTFSDRDLFENASNNHFISINLYVLKRIYSESTVLEIKISKWL